MTAPLRADDGPPRHKMLVCSDEKPRCPYGHRLKPAHRTQYDGTLTCDHRDPLSRQLCGTLCWIAVVSFGGSAQVKGSGERVWIVVEVTPAIVRHFSRTPMTLLERLAYLGHTMPGVDADLFGGPEG
jgi:hypothetical protein